MKIDKLNPMLVGKIKLLIMNPKCEVEADEEGTVFGLVYDNRSVVALWRDKHFIRIASPENFYAIQYVEDKKNALNPKSAFAQIEEAFIKRYNQDQHEKAAGIKKVAKAKEADEKKQKEKVKMEVVNYIDSLLKQNG